jgi:hypothetical protein
MLPIHDRPTWGLFIGKGSSSGHRPLSRKTPLHSWQGRAVGRNGATRPVRSLLAPVQRPPDRSPGEGACGRNRVLIA